MSPQLTNLKGCLSRPNYSYVSGRTLPDARRNCVSRATARTPHSGYHYDNSGRRFFEGWYFKVTLDEPGQAFALIYSIEDPDGGSLNSGVGAQVMGPGDTYLCSYTKDVDTFWAEEGAMELGASFTPRTTAPKRIVPKAEFDETVQHGYQASSSWHQGRLVPRDSQAKGRLPSNINSASWAFSVRPVFGWGSSSDQQKATAGWLASLPVFEPHWQVTMALGKASGWIEWNGKRHEFQEAPAYAEKNWGGGFPKRWFWVQCDRFESSDGQEIALTSVGALRGLLNLPIDEEVGLVGLHWGGQFHEFVPWRGEVHWKVAPWGSWRISATNETHRVLVEAVCTKPGTSLRAPTADNGLSPFCQDSFFGEVRVRLWTKADNISGVGELLLLDASSASAAVEVGGGPWWQTWESSAQMKEPLKSLISIPLDVEAISSRLPKQLQPKGL